MQTDKQIEALMELLKKYNKSEWAEALSSRFSIIDKQPWTIGIIGHNSVPINFVLSMNVSVKRSCSVTVEYGDEDKFDIISDDGMQTVDKDSFLTALDNETDEPLIGRITMNNPIYKYACVTVAVSLHDYNEDFFDNVILQADKIYFVMSAIKLLSAAEKRFIEQYLKSVRDTTTFCILDMDGVISDSERQNVKDYAQMMMTKHFSDDPHIIYELDIQNESLSWKDESTKYRCITKNRQTKYLQYYQKKLLDWLDLIISDDKITSSQETADKLMKVYAELPGYKVSLAREVKMLFVKGVQADIIGKITEFGNKLKSDLKTGIDEEDDTKALTENLGGFILYSWHEFLRSDDMRSLIVKAADTDKQITKYISESLDKLFVKYMSEEESQTLLSYININTDNEDFDIDNGLNSRKLDNDMKNAPSKTRNVVMSSLVLAGGAALATVTLIPGILVALFGAGKLFRHFDKNAHLKEVLYSSGCDFSDKCQTNITNKVKSSFETTESETDADIERVVDDVITGLVELLERKKQFRASAEYEMQSVRDDIKYLENELIED